MTRKNYVTATINLPANVEEYLKEHCSRLLSAPAGVAIETFSKIMDYPEDMVYDQVEIEALVTLLQHFEDEKKGTPKMGVQGVIHGGLYNGKQRKIPQLENSGPINAIIAEIRLYNEIPDTEATLEFMDDQGKLYHIRVYADMVLDTEQILIGDVIEEDCLSFFKIISIEGKAKIEPIKDMTRFELIGKVWDIIKESMEADDEEYGANGKQNFNS